MVKSRAEARNHLPRQTDRNILETIVITFFIYTTGGIYLETV